jgi:glycosyltransferase involved in cell wall biosynthesis
VTKPTISAIVLSFNRINGLRRCIDALRRELEGVEHQIILVDQGSNPIVRQLLSFQSSIELVLEPQNRFGSALDQKRHQWAVSVNKAAGFVKADYFIVLDDDVQMQHGAIQSAISIFTQAKTKETQLGYVGFYYHDYPSYDQYRVPGPCGIAPLAYGLYKTSAFNEVGRFDEGYSAKLSQLGWLLRARQKGYAHIHSHDFSVEHHFAVPPTAWNLGSGPKMLDENSEGSNRCADSRLAPAASKTSAALQYQLESETALTVQKQCFSRCPKISIITVVFRDPKGLERTIESVLSLTYPNIEYIIVDGGSGGDTDTILRRFRNEIDMLISEPDDGIYDAMNKGLSHATGDYCIYMNAGDRFFREDILDSISCYLDGRADVVYGHRQYVTRKREKLQYSNPIEYVVKRMPFCHQSAFYRTSVLRWYPFNMTYKYAADYDQVVQLFKDNAKFYQVDFVICEYVGGGASEEGIRPYLEVLKVQFDNFGSDKQMKESEYMRGFIANVDEFLRRYKA